MAEVLIEFESEFKGPDGRLFHAHASGRPREDGLWEGWLEFVPFDGSEPVQTARETTQPNRDDIMYWATGLTTTYIDGALKRVLTPAPAPAERDMAERSIFPSPAEHAVLNPFEVYKEGDDVLRGQLNALDDARLRTIIREYGIADLKTANAATRAELISLIMLGVEKRVA
jgi:hypothetical protein